MATNAITVLVPDNNPPVDLKSTDFPLLRLRETTAGHARLEMGAWRGGAIQWQPVPIVGDASEAAA